MASHHIVGARWWSLTTIVLYCYTSTIDDPTTAVYFLVLAEAKVSVNKLISTTEFKDILVDTFPSLKGEFTLMKRLPFSKGEGGQLVALVDCNAISDIKQQLNRSALYVRLVSNTITVPTVDDK